MDTQERSRGENHGRDGGAGGGYDGPSWAPPRVFDRSSVVMSPPPWSAPIGRAVDAPTPAAWPDDADLAYWTARAPAWDRAGAPWRPGEADLSAYAAGIAAQAPRTVLVLGATRELAGLPWAPGTRLVLVDRCAAMLTAHGAPEVWGEAWVAQADWRALPLREGVVDLVIGDGISGVLAPGPATRAVAAELGRVMRPGGAVLARMFLRNDRVTLPSVRDAIRGGRVSPDQSRYDLASVLLGASRTGIPRDEVGRAWTALRAGDMGPEDPSWPVFEAWRDSSAPLTLLERAALPEWLGPAFRLADPVPSGLTPVVRYVAR